VNGKWRRAIMEVNREKMLELLENLKNTVVQLVDETEKLETEAEELRIDKREAEKKATSNENKLKEKETKLQSLTEEVEELKNDTSKDEALAEITKERDELKAELDEITSKLSRVSELYREASSEAEKLKEKVDVSDLLSVYIMLIETVFYGKPHAQILYTLHNTKTAISRKNLAQSTGIMPAAVLKSIHDLQNAGLVSYDDETQEVVLEKEIM
jgi:multidrug resistance efflux pump